jgi:Rrf2 family protein
MTGMLNISEATSIALHLCVALAGAGSGFHPTSTISRLLGFSSNHSAKVVQMLVRAGILETGRGPAGGARLAKAADQITLLDVYAAAGGDPKPSGCLLNHAVCRGDGCILGKTFREENERLFSLMKRTRLSTIAANAKINRPKP